MLWCHVCQVERRRGTGLPQFPYALPYQVDSAQSLQSVINDYTVFQELWDDACDAVTDSETQARIGGVKAAMDNFNYLFALVLGEHLLSHTDNLCCTLQSADLAACDAQGVADLTCQTLENMQRQCL